MIRLAIRCHACTPVDSSELAEWLEGQVELLRAAAAGARVRATRLTQSLPHSEVDAGWLLEIEVPEEALFGGSGSLATALADVFRDLRLLGLGPTVLVPIGLADHLDLRAIDKESRRRICVTDGAKSPST